MGYQELCTETDTFEQQLRALTASLEAEAANKLNSPSYQRE